MKTRYKSPMQTVLVMALLTALAAHVNTGQAQVTFQQVTNGLVGWYPLDYVETNGATVTTPDFLSGRDMTLVNMNGASVIASTRPSQNSASVSNCFNFSQGGNGSIATIMYYQSKGQSALPRTGNGDFLPFCNQINATMNFWIKANVDVSTSFNDRRFFGEADDGNGQNGPIWLMGTRSANGLHAHFIFRQDNSGAEILNMVDGTRQVPNYNTFWVQDNNYMGGNLLDQGWHMFTFAIDSNRVAEVYMDGVRDPGPGTFTDMYGNPGLGADLTLTNYYYTTNAYVLNNVNYGTNPPPNGYVRWVWNAIHTKGVTAFGGFRRNGVNTGGFPMYIDDIGFWNRRLNPSEVEFVYTNGLAGIPLVRPLIINSFTADFYEVGQGDSVTLRWNVTGAATNAGGIIISGVGDVSSRGLIGSTNVPLNANQNYNLTLTVHNGVAADTNTTVTVKTFAGVSSEWHLIERFDGVYSDTQEGISGNNWVSAGSDFTGSFDKWNVATLTTGGGSNKVLTPRTGYNPNASSTTGFESRGAVAYARLGSLTMPPGQSNTLFFRFSLREAPVQIPGSDPAQFYFSDLDFGVGLSDYGLDGPSGGLGNYGGSGGGIGPYFSIIRNSGGTYAGAPFDLFAPDRADPAETNTAGSFSYVTSVDPNGLQTNVNYLVWMDVWNRNTHVVTNEDLTTATANQAVYSVWIQKQGDPNRTNVVSGFHGNRNYVNYNAINDLPKPFLDKVFFNIGNESFIAAAAGAYFATNMIAVDDIYLSKSGFTSTIPRLFDLTSITKDSGGVTIKWNSLGSLFGTNTYTIRRTSDLTNPNGWATLATIPAGGSTTTYTDTAPLPGAAYYRIMWP